MMLLLAFACVSLSFTACAAQDINVYFSNGRIPYIAMYITSEGGSIGNMTATSGPAGGFTFNVPGNSPYTTTFAIFGVYQLCSGFAACADNLSFGAAYDVYAFTINQAPGGYTVNAIEMNNGVCEDDVPCNTNGVYAPNQIIQVFCENNIAVLLIAS